MRFRADSRGLGPRNGPLIPSDPNGLNIAQTNAQLRIARLRMRAMRGEAIANSEVCFAIGFKRMHICRLLSDDCRGGSRSEEIARFCGASVERHPLSERSLSTSGDAAGILIAITFERLAGLSPALKSQLKDCVARGATLHVKGELAPGQNYTLAPFVEGGLSAMPATASIGYRLSGHPLMPSALRNEEQAAELAVAAASRLPANAEPLLSIRAAGTDYASIFLVRVGGGIVICDTVPELAADARPLLQALEEPAALPAALGPMVAANRAWKLYPDETFFNLVIDDRPANFDYFNSARLLGLLRHLNRAHPGVHLDFAWTPDQSHPSRSYIETLKGFRTGFVWHGLRRHIDHRSIADLAVEFAAGRRLVDEISLAYGVRFQPVMVFPFERDSPECLDFLRGHGFLAKVNKPAAVEPPAEGPPPAAIDLRSGSASAGRFAILERFPMRLLTRRRMLARAALGLPLIAAAHPPDLGLMRLAKLRPGAGRSFAYFDPLLSFAAEKRLQPASLEEIAYHSIAAD